MPKDRVPTPNPKAIRFKSQKYNKLKKFKKGDLPYNDPTFESSNKSLYHSKQCGFVTWRRPSVSKMNVSLFLSPRYKLISCNLLLYLPNTLYSYTLLLHPSIPSTYTFTLQCRAFSLLIYLIPTPHSYTALIHPTLATHSYTPILHSTPTPSYIAPPKPYINIF